MPNMEIDEDQKRDLLEDPLYLGGGLYLCAVSRDTPVELRARICAALASYMMRHKSIDYTMKLFRDTWDFKDSKREKTELLLVKMIREIRRKIDDTKKLNEKISGLPDHTGLFAAGAALIRLQASFWSGCILASRGYGFETYSICRVILEQLAWAMHVYEINDKSLFKIKPNSCIHSLKPLFLNIGKLHGHLSDHTHIHPKTSLEYISFEKEYPQIFLASPKAGLRAAFDLLVLADIHAVVSEFVYRNFIPSRRNFLRKKKDETLKINVKRKFNLRINQYRKELGKLGIMLLPPPPDVPL